MSEQPTLSVRIATRVRGLCAEKRMTQMRLAESLRLPQASISRRMRGETAWSLDELAEVCRLLDVDFALAIGDVPAAVS